MIKVDYNAGPFEAEGDWILQLKLEGLNEAENVEDVINVPK